MLESVTRNVSVSSMSRFSRGGWIDRLKTVWYVIGAASPLILAGLAVAGSTSRTASTWSART